MRAAPPRAPRAAAVVASVALTAGVASAGVALLLATPGAAHAQDRSALAQLRFERGVQLYDARQYAPALEEFRASLNLYASPNSRLYIARCLRELGRLDEAVLEFQRAAREAQDRAHTDPRYAAAVQAAEGAVASLLPRLGRLTLATPGVAAPSRVEINGRELPAAVLGLPIPVLPGTVTVLVEAEGFVPARRTTEVTAGAEVALAVELERAAPRAGGASGAASSQPPLRDRPPTTTPAGSQLSVPLVATGVTSLVLGVAGLATFGAFAGLGQAHFAALESRCPMRACTGDESAAIATGESYQLAANVGLGVGVSLTVLGTALLLFSRRPAAAPARPAATAVGVSGNGVVLRGAF